MQDWTSNDCIVVLEPAHEDLFKAKHFDNVQHNNSEWRD